MRCQPLAIGFVLVLSICLGDEAMAKGKGGGGAKQFGGGKGSANHAPKWDGSHGNGGTQLTKERPIPKDRLIKQQSPRTDTSSGPLADPKKAKQLQLFQQHRNQKLAQADHLRQLAERNGNANLAANADRMEAQALQQYADKVRHLEKFGVTDPLLNPQQPPVGGDLLSDPIASP